MMRPFVFLLMPVMLMAQVEAPRIGCFSSGDNTFSILGVAGSFVLERAETCDAIANLWRVTSDEEGSPWLERIDAVSGAVEHRQKLERGQYGVWPDGTLAPFDAIGLPAPVSEWLVVSKQWMLLRLGEYWALLNAEQKWFYLPMPVEVSE